MAQLDLTPVPGSGQGRLSVRRCAFTGAIVAGVLFAVHGFGLALHLGGMMYGAMPAFGMMATAGGLIFGLLCTLVGGLVVGALVAVTYNALEFTARRSS